MSGLIIATHVSTTTIIRCFPFRAQGCSFWHTRLSILKNSLACRSELVCSSFSLPLNRFIDRLFVKHWIHVWNGGRFHRLLTNRLSQIKFRLVDVHVQWFCLFLKDALFTFIIIGNLCAHSITLCASIIGRCPYNEVRLYYLDGSWRVNDFHLLKLHSCFSNSFFPKILEKMTVFT